MPPPPLGFAKTAGDELAMPTKFLRLNRQKIITASAITIQYFLKNSINYLRAKST